MTNIIYNASGSAIPGIVIDRIQQTKGTKTIIQELPGAGYDIVQNLGIKNKRFVLEGYALATGSLPTSPSLATSKTNLEWLDGRTGSFSSNVISQGHVLFTNVDVDDKAGRPLELRFSIEAVEVYTG